jgi:hypothetical protein
MIPIIDPKKKAIPHIAYHSSPIGIFLLYQYVHYDRACFFQAILLPVSPAIRLPGINICD